MTTKSNLLEDTRDACRYCGTSLSRDPMQIQAEYSGYKGVKSTWVCPQCGAGYTSFKTYGGTVGWQGWDEPGSHETQEEGDVS